MQGSAVTGSVQHEGITYSSNTRTDDEIRASLGVETPTQDPETTEAPAESEAVADAPPIAAPEKPAEPKAKKKLDPTKDPEVRISKATFEREEARREAAKERAERERIAAEYAEFKAKHEKPVEPAKPAQPSADAEPTLDQFADQPDPYAAWMRALAKHDLKQEMSAREKAMADQREQARLAHVQQQREQAEHARIASFGQKLTEAFAANPTLEAQMAASDITVTRPMADAIIESDAPDKLIAYLLANEAEVDRIAALESPLKQFRALARLDATLDAPAAGHSGAPAPKKTQAQPPISPVGGTQAAPASGPPDPKTCTQEEWDDYYNRQEREARQAGRR